jgi:hypothetical protein
VFTALELVVHKNRERHEDAQRVVVGQQNEKEEAETAAVRSTNGEFPCRAREEGARVKNTD